MWQSVFDGIEVSGVDCFARLCPGMKYKSPAGRRLQICDWKELPMLLFRMAIAFLLLSLLTEFLSADLYILHREANTHVYTWHRGKARHKVTYTKSHSFLVQNLSLWQNLFVNMLIISLSWQTEKSLGTTAEDPDLSNPVEFWLIPAHKLVLTDHLSLAEQP